VLIGFPSDGLHANGWTLVRKCLKELGRRITRSEVAEMLAPTRLYHEEVRALRRRKVRVRAMAHITGGGLPENLGRLLGKNGAEIEIPPWTRGAIPKLLALCEPSSAIETFNMGWGWVAVVDKSDARKAIACGEGARLIGEVLPHRGVRVMVR
jgi:phosphoribosylformylglycinamidine cyclo-ligase